MGGTATQSVVMPWTVIDGPAAAAGVRRQTGSTPISRARLTSISAALKFSQDLFDGSGVKGIRRVIDVSGDGPNNAGRAGGARARRTRGRRHRHQRTADHADTAVSTTFDLSDLDSTTRNCVIGGAGAFMVPVKELKEFASAIRRKLLLEISGFGTPARRHTRAECAAGGSGTTA